MKTLNALVLLGCLAAPCAAQTSTSSAAADVVGTWNATVTTTQGQEIPAALTLKKDGGKVAGVISSEAGESPVQAEVKGQTLTVTFTFQGQNGPMGIVLDGTVAGDAVKGTMTVDGQAGGNWTATRDRKDSKEPAAAPTAPTTTTATKTDLSGNWSLSIELPNMQASPAVVLKQDGDKLTGDYVSAQYGKYALTGTVKGADVSFWFAMNIEGNALNVNFTGTVDKDGSLKGSVSYGDMMSGTFVAAKKK
jgi:hypothetical protein